MYGVNILNRNDDVNLTMVPVKEKTAPLNEKMARQQLEKEIIKLKGVIDEKDKLLDEKERIIGILEM